MTRLAAVARRTWVGAALVLAVACLFWWAHASGDHAVALYVGTALSALAIFEVSRMGTLRGRGLGWTLGAAACVLFPFNHRLTQQSLPERLLDGTQVELSALLSAYALVSFVAVAVYLVLRFNPIGPWSVGALELHLGCAVWLLVPLPALFNVWRNHGFGGVLALVVLSKLGDIAGYYVGNAMGKAHPFPNLSPGKTVAGCVGSLVAGTLGGGLFVVFGGLPDGSLGVAGGLAAGLVVNVAAQAGDLLESAVKRRAGVKDSSGIFGPAGGVLDLLDSLFLSVPAALVVWPLIFD